jgi:chromosomal replication initiator protein
LPDDDYLLRELRYTLDAIEQNGGLLVVTSSRPVVALANLSQDVRSRLASGLMLQLATPGTAARMRIVRQLASALGRPLSDEVIGQLAAGLNSTANQLLGALHELWASLPGQRAPDTDQSKSLLSARASRHATLPAIVTVVCRHYGVSRKLLKNSSRRQSAVLARATVVYLARELTDASYEQIGAALGGRDHTTIMHNYRKIQHDMQRDLALLESIEDLRRIVLSH